VRLGGSTVTDWQRGFQDALELSLAELKKAKSKEAAGEELQKYLDVTVESKLGKLKNMMQIARGE
jgi:hypothetical protein